MCLRRGASQSRTALCRERSEEHTSELQSRLHLVCRLLLEKKKNSTTELKLQLTISTNHSRHLYVRNPHQHKNDTAHNYSRDTVHIVHLLVALCSHHYVYAH